MAQFKLLTPGNPKTEKGKGAGYWTFILHLAPASLSGFNVCPMATEGCKAACLNTAGRGGIMAGHGILTAADVANGIRNTIQNARIRKTLMLFRERDAFLDLLVREIRLAIRKAREAGYKPAFRLNGTSDLRWESLRIGNSANVFAMFPDVQFYDYTKIANRKNIPANYALTFSLADGNESAATNAILDGMNVAVVFRDQATVERHIAKGRYGINLIIRGDETDLRFLDAKGPNGRGLVVALYAKGNAKRDQSGFVKD
jgi:hypothetical protein